MTRHQEAAIAKIRKYIEQNDLFRNDPRYEIKEFEITDEGDFVQLYIVTGLKDDEGTLASVLCRKKRQIFIGKRGGLRAYRWNNKIKKSTRLEGFTDVMIFGYSY